MKTFSYGFASICTPTENNRVLPPLIHDTNSKINSFRVSNKDILSIIKSLYLSKSREYDNVLTRMVKICSESVTILSKKCSSCT